MRRRIRYFFTMTVSCCLLSGCHIAARPGQEPFGEQTYSGTEARAVYEEVCAAMGQAEFSGWSGYSIRMDEDMVSHDIYRTEEYMVGWHEGTEREYLWYQGQLYCYDGGTVAYRDMGWDELNSDSYAAEQWEFACGLLGQEPVEMEYKYIPMSSGSQYQLTLKYHEASWEGQARQFPQVRFRLDGENNFSGFVLHWQEGSGRTIDISFFPYEGSASLQAEREIWGFAHELGLTEEGVPALSEQEDDRERCRSVVSGIDFEDVSGWAVYQDDLAFPVPPGWDDEAGIPGGTAGR